MLKSTPDILESFSASIATPILEQQPDQAQDYLQSIITAYDRSWQTTTRRHRVRPVAGPPDDAPFQQQHSSQTHLVHRQSLQQARRTLYPSCGSICLQFLA